jgi:hypothetical protein
MFMHRLWRIRSVRITRLDKTSGARIRARVHASWAPLRLLFPVNSLPVDATSGDHRHREKAEEKGQLSFSGKQGIHFDGLL